MEPTSAAHDHAGVRARARTDPSATLGGAATNGVRDGAAGRSGTVQTLDRGLRVLELLAAEPDALAINELAARLGLERTIVYRLQRTLTDHHLVTRGRDGRYALGAGLRHRLDLGATGVAILAGRPPRAGERAEVTAARVRGYAVSHGELQRGMSCVAAPIHVGSHPADASIGVVTLGEIDAPSIAPPVLQAAHTIAAALG